MQARIRGRVWSGVVGAPLKVTDRQGTMTTELVTSTVLAAREAVTAADALR